MKTVIPCIAVSLLVTSVNPFSESSSVQLVIPYSIQQQERAQVDIDSLPEKVKASVGHNTELAWKILKAYLVTNPDKTTFYDLYVQKPDGETWIKVDKDGTVLN